MQPHLPPRHFTLTFGSRPPPPFPSTPSHPYAPPQHNKPPVQPDEAHICSFLGLDARAAVDVARASTPPPPPPQRTLPYLGPPSPSRQKRFFSSAFLDSKTGRPPGHRTTADRKGKGPGASGACSGAPLAPHHRARRTSHRQRPATRSRHRASSDKTKHSSSSSYRHVVRGLALRLPTVRCIC